MEEQTLKEILEDIKKNSKNPELIQDNKAYFEYKNEWYRTRMPTQKELTEANQYRNKIRIQLLQRGKKEGYLFKKDLIKVLKDNDIDIEALEEEIEKLKKEYIQLALTASRKKDEEQDTIEKLEREAEEIEEKIRKVSNEKAEHLSPCIEYQAEDAWYKILTANCTEKAKDETKEEWIKVWSNFEKFQQDNSDLSYIAEASLSKLVQNG